MTESFSVIPETVRFSSLMEQLSNDTTGCEIAFLPAMSNNYLRGEIIAQGILASQKKTPTMLPIISGLVLVAQSVHFCGLFVAGIKENRQQEVLKVCRLQVTVWGKNMGFVLLSESWKASKVDFTDQLVDWSETCCGLKEMEDPLGCFHISTEDISPEENSAVFPWTWARLPHLKPSSELDVH